MEDFAEHPQSHSDLEPEPGRPATSKVVLCGLIVIGKHDIEHVSGQALSRFMCSRRSPGRALGTRVVPRVPQIADGAKAYDAA